jgi:hypothetical protein
MLFAVSAAGASAGVLLILEPKPEKVKNMTRIRTRASARFIEEPPFSFFQASVKPVSQSTDYVFAAFTIQEKT